MSTQSRADVVVRAVRAAVPNWTTGISAGRRIDSPFAGMHRTTRTGPGEEWSDARLYTPGDDVRRIDWAATARTGDTQVRDTYAERSLRLTLVVDCSPSMQFGTSTLTKSELALGAATAVSLVCARQGDSVAAMLVSSQGLHWVPPGSGVAHVNVLLRRLKEAASLEGSTSFPNGVRRAAALATTPGMFVVLSDFRDVESAPALRRLAAAHRTLAVVIDDPRDYEIPSVGPLELLDPESGAVYHLDTDNQAFRDRYAIVASRRRESRDAALRTAGAAVTHLECGPNWLQQVAKLVSGAVR